MGDFNKDHAASIGYVGDAIAEAWGAMKVWVNTNVDQSNIMTVVKGFLDAANRQVIGTTATEKAQAIAASVDAMVQAFTEAGISMQGITTAQFAQCIASLAVNSGVWIQDTDGVLWTAASWAHAKEQGGGMDPAQRQGIFIKAVNAEFLIASKNYGTMQFGTYGHTIPNLQAMAGGSAGTPYNGEYNARKILAATDPDACDELGFAVTYSQGMTDADLVDKDLVFFPNQETLTSWATEMGLATMVTIGQTMLYAIPHANYTESNHLYILKYFNGTNSISFANREAQVPYTDNYGQIGCTALRAAMSHREYNDDPMFWRLSCIFEILLKYLNKAAIDECRAALGEQPLPSAQEWSDIQYSYASEYYLSLADGSSNYINKNYLSWVVPVASSTRPSAA